jgi:ankyrin repeat protein
MPVPTEGDVHRYLPVAVFSNDAEFIAKPVPTKEDVLRDLFAAVSANEAKTLEDLLTSGDNRAELAKQIVKGYKSVNLLDKAHSSEVVNILLENGAWVKAECYHTGQTALHRAVIVRNDKKVLCLLAVGANVNARDYMGDTPLHIAVSYRRESTIRILLEAKARVNVINGGGDTPLHLAVGCSRIMDLLLQAKPPPDPYWLRFFLAEGPGQPFDSGWTPLYRAASSNDVNSAIKLLSHGANPFSNSECYGSAFDTGMEGGRDNLVKAMLEYVIEKCPTTPGGYILET